MDIIKAREKRGWTVYEACRRGGIGRQCLVNLEEGPTKPQDVKAGTMLRLLELYWPDVSLEDFLGCKTKLTISRASRRSRGS